MIDKKTRRGFVLLQLAMLVGGCMADASGDGSIQDDDELAEDEDVGMTSGALTNCGVLDSEVGVWVDAFKGGKCDILSQWVGWYPRSWSADVPNDSISSYQVGSGVVLKACTDANWGGSCFISTANDWDLSRGSFNDRISSMEVIARYANGSEQWVVLPTMVSIWSDTSSVAGVAAATTGTKGIWSPLGPGDYPNAVSFGLANDSLSRFTVGSKAQVTFCTDAGFKGTCKTFGPGTSTANMSGTGIPNDSVSSIRIVALP